MSDSLIVQINNKLNYLIAKAKQDDDESDALSIRTVDFIVDLFDRADSDSPGSYWTDPDYGALAIRDGVCMPSSNDSITIEMGDMLTAMAFAFFVGAGPVIFSVSVFGEVGPALNFTYRYYHKSYGKNNMHNHLSMGADLTTKIISRYRTKLRSHDFHIRLVMVSEPSKSILENITLNSSNAEANVTAPYFFSGSAVFGENAFSFMANVITGYFHPHIPNIANNQLLESTITHIPSGLYETTSAAIEKSFADSWPYYSSSIINSSDFILGSERSFKPGQVVDDTQQTTIGGGYIRAGISIGSHDIPDDDAKATINGGEDVIEISWVGQSYTVKINGDIVHNIESNEIVNRAFAGIAFPAYNMAGANSAHGITSGIKSFKAWVDGTPEPPDETGHGDYDPDSGDGIPYKYSDKYHEKVYQTQIVDGRERRVHVGYEYNPDAE